MKKMLCMLLAMVMILAVFQVSFAEESAYKIAILTGTTSQGEEEYYAARALMEKYPGVVVPGTGAGHCSSGVAAARAGVRGGAPGAGGGGGGCVAWEMPVALSDDSGSANVACLLLRIGDVNGDGAGAEDALPCTLDLQTLYDYLALRQVPGSFCDSADAARNELLVRYFLRLADVNEDGQVDNQDYQRLYLLESYG